MQTKMMLLLAAFVAVIGLSSCASVNSTNTRSLLSASGFRERTPETAKQKELYAAAEPYKLLRVTAKGKTVYAYKDPKTGTALVGSESNYQQYQKLATEQRIAREQYEAAEMAREAAYGWYGAYGFGYSPYGPGPGGYGYGYP